MPRSALYTNESFYEDGTKPPGYVPGYVIAIATENEPGYHIFSYGFQTVADAQKVADEMNAALGRTEDDVMEIVASSMRVQ
jgi:hypothetical protein